jgi:hypothetical protein
LKLRIGGVPEHFNYLWKLPETRESFRNRGFYYEWIDFPGGTGAMVTALENGDLDIAIMLTEGAISAISNHKTFRIKQPFVMSPLIWGVFSSTRSRNEPIPGFAEAKFAVSRKFSGSHLMAKFLAMRQGIKLHEDQFVVSNNLDGARKALQEGSADYFLWEKWMTRFLVHAGEFTEVDTIAAPWPAFVFVVNNNAQLDWEPLKAAIDDAVLMFESLEQNELLNALAIHYNLTVADVQEWKKTVKYFDGNEYWKDRMTAAAIIMHGNEMIEIIPSQAELF